MSKVMLVEDDETMRSLISMLLEMEGFQVFAHDGSGFQESILQSVDQEKPDVLLLDVNIRGQSSVGLLEALKKVSSGITPRIIMSSGMALAEECLAMGADDFILKPYMPDELLEKIRILIERE